MITIGKNIKDLPKKELKKWIASQSHRESKDWKDALAELKVKMDANSKSSKESTKD